MRPGPRLLITLIGCSENPWDRGNVVPMALCEWPFLILNVKYTFICHERRNKSGWPHSSSVSNRTRFMACVPYDLIARIGVKSDSSRVALLKTLFLCQN